MTPQVCVKKRTGGIGSGKSFLFEFLGYLRENSFLFSFELNGFLFEWLLSLKGEKCFIRIKRLFIRMIEPEGRKVLFLFSAKGGGFFFLSSLLSSQSR